MNLKTSLLALVSIGLTNAALSAQAPIIVEAAPTNGPIVQTSGFGDGVTVVSDPSLEYGRNRPVRSFLNNHGMACYSHHTQLGCGSFHSEFRFIFGSCRAFFMDPCVPNPPHLRGVLGSARGSCGY